MLLLDMKNYLIIGGSSGIGQAIAMQLSQGDNMVYATYHKHPIEHSKSNIQYSYFNCLDVCNFDFLPEKLDGLVYCPGNISLKPFARIKEDEFLADFQLQVMGAIKTIQAVLPKLKASGSASIVVFSTVAVQLGLNFHSLVSTSKGALEGLTKALAAELSPTIRVNCIAPSLTNTPLAASLLNTEEKINSNAQRHPLKRIGTASDIANMAEFLLSEKSSWITGQIMHVDGGLMSLKV